MRIGLATSADLPALDVDSRLLLQALGDEAEPAVWDDPAVEWAAYDLVVVRSCWDYTLRHAEFLAWARSVPRLANPATVLAWNTDKAYLRDLAAAGVPVVPTAFVPPGAAYGPPAGEVVVKPTVSAGARDTERHADGRDGAALVARLHAQGRTAMVQPYLSRVEDEGETSVVLLGGAVSHGGRKAPLLARGSRAGPDYTDDEVMSPREPTPEQVAVARAAVAVAPAGCLYARVDLVPGADGAPVVLELELTEPSLFLRLAPGSAARLAAAVRATAG